MDVRYYYYRDADNRPLVTLARVKDSVGRIGYGFAICSPYDNPCKQVGKSIAKFRAMAALEYPEKGFFFENPGHIALYNRAVVRDEAYETLYRVHPYLRIFLSHVEYDETLLPMSMRASA